MDALLRTAPGCHASRSSLSLRRNSSSGASSSCTSSRTPSSYHQLRRRHNDRASPLRAVSPLDPTPSSSMNESSSGSSMELAAPPSSSRLPAGSAASDDDFGYMSEYTALKAQLLDNTRKCGGAIGAYLLLTVGGGPALTAMLGVAASYGYVSWLAADVDAVAATDRVPVWEANKIENPVLRRAAKVAAAYRAALNPRLLVPVGLALGVGAVGALTGERVPLLYDGCLVVGFLSYKFALLIKVLDDVLPKSYSSTERSRPRVDVITDDLDMWGRRKRQGPSPIDVMPEKAAEAAQRQLDKRMGEEAAPGGAPGDGGRRGGSA